MASIRPLIKTALLLAVSALSTQARADEQQGADGAASANSTWQLSTAMLPIGKDKAIGVQLHGNRVMWIGGNADDPADNNRCFIYDLATRTFRETAPVPAAKRMDGTVEVGVLDDGSVIVAGGAIDPAGSSSQLSYRYDPETNRWTRTGDLPEQQNWIFTPTIRLWDGRLLIAGGNGLEGFVTGAGSLHAFVFDNRLFDTVAAIDPDTGAPTGARQEVRGKWDYTRRVEDHAISNVGSGHLFGNEVLLNDGRVLIGGGHTLWALADSDASILSTEMDYFDPETGAWSAGSPLPAVAGEDDRIPESHGGRANGVCFATMDDGEVVIAGGNSQTDGAGYFETAIGRQSILVLTPARNPAKGKYRLSPNPIPSGADFGGVFGDGGRNQLLCYALPGSRVMIAGGQDVAGDDLYDTYIFDSKSSSVTQGPDMAHAAPVYVAEHPEWGYPAGYEAAAITSRAVGMHNSQLVSNDGALLHGGGYNADGDDNFFGSRQVEQLGPAPGRHHRNPPCNPTAEQRAAAKERQRRRGR